jgi:hypothetical protein
MLRAFRNLLRNAHLASMMIFLFAIGNCFLSCQLADKVALVYFTGLSQDGGQSDFAKKSLPSLFNGDLSNHTTFHLDRQCL